MCVSRYLDQLNTTEDNNTWNRHRIVVVGLHKAGKTRLVQKILEKETVQTNSTNQGLHIHEWKTKSKTLHFWKRLDSIFDIWDFSGDPVSRLTMFVFLNPQMTFSVTTKSI